MQQPILNRKTCLLWLRADLIMLGLVVAVWSINTAAFAANQPELPAAAISQPEAELGKIARQAEQPVYEPTIAGAKQAMQDKNYPAALNILIKLEADYAGQVEYDYLLGRVAHETKNFDAAVAALTRVLTVDPDFAAARFELARTYYSKGVSYLARGPFEQARNEFSLVARMTPPADLKQAIDQYQTNIDKYLKVREAEFRLFAELTGGYDTNIGTAPKNDQFSYYDYGTATTRTFDLNADQDRKDSSFGQLQTGIGLDWPLFSNNFEIFGNLMAGGRSYGDNHDYDHVWDEVQFGARHYGDSNVKTLRFRFRKTDKFDSFGKQERYHEMGETMFKIAVKNNDHSAVSFWFLGGNSNYNGNGNNNLYVFSVNYNRQAIEFTHLAYGPRKATLQVLLMTGQDHEQECNMGPCPEIYTRELKGIRAGWGVDYLDASRLYMSLYVEDSQYEHDFYYQQRRDKRFEAFIGSNTRFGDNWYFRPEIHYTQNSSSHAVYEHDRWLVSMTVGWGI